PMNLIYPGGKILTIKEETTEGRILQEVEIKTLDQLGVVKNFYNNQANDPAWKLTSQTNGALDVRYECWQENKKLIMVITGNPFTKLVKVRIIYEQLE
ncbi:MAG TPA: hypothetical protein VJB37_00705, partial [Patescibacteria group bacterium]|nr:hypothetical protein [Patescibacteria group bacterium]